MNKRPAQTSSVARALAQALRDIYTQRATDMVYVRAGCGKAASAFLSAWSRLVTKRLAVDRKKCLCTYMQNVRCRTACGMEPQENCGMNSTEGTGTGCCGIPQKRTRDECKRENTLAVWPRKYIACGMTAKNRNLRTSAEKRGRRERPAASSSSA